MNPYYLKDEHLIDFDKDTIIEKLDEISEEIEKERKKPIEERDSKHEFDLIYRQFIQGLKLSVNMKKF